MRTYDKMDFLMDNKRINKKIVCLGGGIGTVNLLLGIKNYYSNITTIVSMADNGGSSGRLRRLYNTIPVGDIISCMAAMRNNKQKFSDILTYRFEGARYGKDYELGGHKLGNLLILALKDLTGSYEKAIKELKKIFEIEGEFLPATENPVDISAITIEGKEIFGEEKIDLGKYKGKRILKEVRLHPFNATPAINVIENLKNANTIILGPGDLYTNLLPVLIIPKIKEILKITKAKIILIINIANKPFETKDYFLEDYMEAIKRHIGEIKIDYVFSNNNYKNIIPKKYKYTYVKIRNEQKLIFKIIFKDFVKDDFPIYHDSKKLADEIKKII